MLRFVEQTADKAIPLIRLSSLPITMRLECSAKTASHGESLFQKRQETLDSFHVSMVECIDERDHRLSSHAPYAAS